MALCSDRVWPPMLKQANLSFIHFFRKLDFFFNNCSFNSVYVIIKWFKILKARVFVKMEPVQGRC